MSDTDSGSEAGSDSDSPKEQEQEQDTGLESHETISVANAVTRRQWEVYDTSEAAVIDEIASVVKEQMLGSGGELGAGVSESVSQRILSDMADMAKQVAPDDDELRASLIVEGFQLASARVFDEQSEELDRNVRFAMTL